MPFLNAYKAFVSSRQWPAAVSVAEQGMGVFPENPLWAVLCAEALTHAGRLEESLRRAETAENLFAASSGGLSSADMANMWLSCGLAAFLEKNYPHASFALEKTLRYEPDNKQARHVLLLCFVNDEGLGEGRILEDILPDGPANEEEACVLGSLFQAKGMLGSSRDVWERYQKKTKKSSPLLQARIALSLPAILGDAREACAIRETMAGFFDNADAMPPCEGPLAAYSPMLVMPTPPFYLAFHGKDDRKILSRLAGFVLRHLAVPGPPAGDSGTPSWSRMAALRPSGRRRIGFLSRNMTHHTVMSYFFTLLMQLKNRLPHCFFLEFPQKDNPFRTDLARTRSLITLPHDLDAAREAIKKLRLDILVYLDLGMDPLTWFLAHSRLAPVQCALYGHPATTGIATVDFFLSPAIMEPENAASRYSETLVTFPGLLSGFLHFPEPVDPVRHGSLFPAPRGTTHTEYVCAQNLFKIHPDMDETIRHIARSDPTARMHLFVSRETHETEALRVRLKRTLGSASARINWLPQCSEERFLAILQQADVVLDSPYFSGGGTSYKALGVGVPVVTLEGEFMRGRQTAGLYRHMGVDGRIACTFREWGEMALALAHSPDKRAALRENLLARRASLFDAENSVDHLASFLLKQA